MSNIVSVKHIRYDSNLDDEYVIYYSNGLEEHTTKLHNNVKKFIDEHDCLEYNTNYSTTKIY